MLKVKSLTRNSSALDRNEKKKHIASREEIRIQGKFLVVESHYRLDPESKFLTEKEFGTTWNLDSTAENPEYMTVLESPKRGRITAC